MMQLEIRGYSVKPRALVHLIQRWGLTPGHTTDKLGFTWVFGRSFNLSKVAPCATLGE